MIRNYRRGCSLVPPFTAAATAAAAAAAAAASTAYWYICNRCIPDPDTGRSPLTRRRPTVHSLWPGKVVVVQNK